MFWGILYYFHLIPGGGVGIFLCTTASRTALGPTQPPIQWVPGILSLGVKRPGREADHSPPSSAEVKNAWSYTSAPPIRLHSAVLSLAHGQLYRLYLHVGTGKWNLAHSIYGSMHVPYWTPCEDQSDCKLSCPNHLFTSLGTSFGTYFFKIHICIIIPSTPRSPTGQFITGFPTKVYTFVISPCVLHVPPISASSCNFLQSPVPSSLLGPNVSAFLIVKTAEARSYPVTSTWYRG
jgi:hypothetical protein